MMQRLSLNWHNQLKVIRTVTTVGQRERATQQRVIRFFIEELGYRYLGDWHKRPNNRNVEPDLLSHWLIDRGVPICSPYTQTIGQDRLPGWGQSITN